MGAENYVTFVTEFSCHSLYRYTNAGLKISVYVRIHIKTIPWKLCILNPKNSQVICPKNL